MSLIKCPKCEKEISGTGKYCIGCGHQLTLNQSEAEYSNTENLIKPKGKFKKWILSHKLLSIFMVVVILFCSIGLPIILSNSKLNNEIKLTGNDKIAYDKIIKYSSNFKDESSVRVVSGTVGSTSCYFILSAKNSYGARSTDAYMIWTNDGVERIDKIETTSFTYSKVLFENTYSFDIDKVNAALDKKWESFK